MGHTASPSGLSEPSTEPDRHAETVPDGFFIVPHNHPRDQLIYAIAGVARIETANDARVVPAGKDHCIQVLGDVEMQTLYIAPSETAEIKVLSVIAVPVLLDP